MSNAITSLQLSRDEWLVINRALQDRVSVLSRRPGQLVGQEIAECERLEKITRAHVDETWVAPSDKEVA